ncbi:patatin-like phospholipase family protein [Burkholderia thailandensis]|uniref:patatin-like phospholipase family protein n=2 Tax=Burkholderia TaxID=32008 RepID=UPI0023619900|nr:patatin-like phospholipase family protein [Burkholderia thailandensis]
MVMRNELNEIKSAAEPSTQQAALPGQVVLVLQGGGALGSYQAGVYEALHAAGIEPDWIIGTSIGAVNGAIIAGNRTENRLVRLREFWSGAARHEPWPTVAPYAGASNVFRNMWTVAYGLPGFFEPRFAAWFGPHTPLGAESASYYSTAPLEGALAKLIDFPYLNDQHMRLSIATVGVRSGEMRYLSNRDTELRIPHVMASAALPPAFPAVRIDGEAYWDGGIHSNTPIEAIWDDHPRRDAVVFSVQLWPMSGTEPETVWQVLGRQKDIQYASRTESQLQRQRQIHRLRHIIRELGRLMNEDARESPEVKKLLEWGCGTTMHVVQLKMPRFDGDDYAKDIDFSADGVQTRWDAGYRAARSVLEAAPWRHSVDPIEGIAVHEIAAPTE